VQRNVRARHSYRRSIDNWRHCSLPDLKEKARPRTGGLEPNITEEIAKLTLCRLTIALPGESFRLAAGNLAGLNSL
jgi:hypothetical protein